MGWKKFTAQWAAPALAWTVTLPYLAGKAALNYVDKKAEKAKSNMEAQVAQQQKNVEDAYKKIQDSYKTSSSEVASFSKRNLLANRNPFGSTLLTSPFGDTSKAKITKKTLLGF